MKQYERKGELKGSKVFNLQETWVDEKTNKWLKIKAIGEGVTRKLAEEAYKDWKEASSKGWNGTVLMKEIAERVGYEWGYLKKLKMIPQKLYSYVEEGDAGISSLEEHGYSKFEHIAAIEDDSFRKKLFKETIDENLPRQEIRNRIREHGLDAVKGEFEFRPIVPYGENIFFQSEKRQANRPNDFCVIKEGSFFPTLKRRTWFFHEGDKEFSLREYAEVQGFPNDFKFIGTKERIKDQIGNAVAPPMAYYISQFVKGKTFIELFAGCGGSSLGLEQAGWKCLWMNERSPSACLTFNANFPHVFVSNKDIKRVKIEDIKKQTNGKEIDLVMGGPPCNGFSIAGNKFKDDIRNELYKEFVRVVGGIKPKHFIMENVMGIKPFKEQIIKDFEEVGYKVDFKEVRGEDIGMRQRRHRCFFVGAME